MLPDRISVYLNKEMHMEFEDIVVTVTRFSKIEDDGAWEISSHAHLNYELHYIYDGTGRIGLGSNDFVISKGEFYICPPFIDHSQMTNDIHPMKEFCIECTLDIKAQENEFRESDNFYLLQMISRILYCKHNDYNGVLQKNFELLNQMCENRAFFEEGEELLVKSLLLNAVLSMLVLARKDSGMNVSLKNNANISYQRASAIKNYLEANYKQDISIRDCARFFFLSERQVDRIMVKVYGETFHEMLTKTRVNIAVNLMRTTDYPVELVSMEAGFSGYRQMLRGFKRYGIEQPTKLRKDSKREEIKRMESLSQRRKG